MIEKVVELPQRLIEIETCRRVVHVSPSACWTVFNREIATASPTCQKGPSGWRQFLRDYDKRRGVTIATLNEFGLDMLVIESIPYAEICASILKRVVTAREDRPERLAMGQAIFVDPRRDNEWRIGRRDRKCAAYAYDFLGIILEPIQRAVDLPDRDRAGLAAPYSDPHFGVSRARLKVAVVKSIEAAEVGCISGIFGEAIVIGCNNE